MMSQSVILSLFTRKVSTLTGVLVIAYSYPIPGAWDSIVAAKLANPSVPIVAAVNPNSGPDTKQNPDYTGGINYLQKYGVTVIGYVATTYANKPLPTAMTEVDLWKQFYPMTQGIFFDEMSNVPGNEAYYSALKAYAKGFTVGNPGADSSPSYVGTMDTIVIHEDVDLPTTSFLDGWHSDFPKSNFGSISYARPTLDSNWVNQAKPYLGWIYLTDGVLPNPYGAITPYLGQLAALL